MKYFSGDFIALYNSAISQYRQEQIAIDTKYEDVINELISRESSRIESTTSAPFSIGDYVETIDGRVGEVIDCPVHIDLKIESDYFSDPSGPNRFLPLKTDEDEVTATCEGMIRKVFVKFKSSEIEIDWGKENTVYSFYPDELSTIKK